MPFRITLDNMCYHRKPNDSDVRAITARLKQMGSREFDAASLAQFVRAGGTFVGGCFEPSSGKWGAFQSMQVCALDFDNDTSVTYLDRSDPERKTKRTRKRALFPDEVGYLSPAEAVARCEELGIEPMLLYFTKHNSPTWCRYRIVIDLGEPITDEAEASGIVRTLLSHFGEADQSCSNLNRLYYGSNGTVIELWKGEALA